METLFINIVKSSGLIAIFYIAYYLLLRKETFFTANRWFLLAGLFTSAILPWIVFTTIVWVDPAPNNIDWSKIPVTAVREESFEINWYYVVAIAYIIGSVYLIIQFAYDFYHLRNTIKGKTIQQQADYKFIDTKENIAPFSYFNTIVYNSSLYSESEIQSILEHEKVHSEQYHTIDVLITRFFCILFWFNPFIWLYKKAILQNLEFIADSEATKNVSDKKAYQLTLLKITTHENCVAITNHFYQSLIKKRIVMLNKNQSKNWNYWKYALILPVLVAFMFLFQIEAIAQEKATTGPKNVIVDEIKHFSSISATTTNQTLNSETKLFRNKFNADVTFSEIKRNSNNEITAIKVEITSPNTTKNTFIYSENLPIQEFVIFAGRLKNKETVVGLHNRNSKSNKWKQTVSYIIPPPMPLPPTVKSTTTPPALPPKVKSSHTAPPPPPLPPTVKSTTTPPALPPKVSTIKFSFPTEKNQIIASNDNNKTITTDQPIIIIDGVKADSKTTINDLNIDAIKSMSVFKREFAIKKYGESGKNGVIEITTKENATILKESPKKD